MEEQQFNIRYTAQGHRVHLVEELQSGGYVAQSIWEDDETGEETLDGSRFIIKQLFNTPPREKLDEQIARLKNEADALVKQKLELQRQVAEIQKQEKERLEKYKQYSQLKRLDDFLEGRITHYVYIRYGSVKVVEFDKLHCEYDKDKLKLLTLYGKSNGDLQYKINRYSDGSSGDEWTCIPCVGQEEVDAAVQEFLTKRFNAQKPDIDFVREADKFGFPIPDDYRKEAVKSHNEGLLRSIKSNEEQNERYREKLMKEEEEAL